MTKILCSADWHILLHKKKVPYTWQMSRFKSMFAKLLDLERDCDVHIVAGDIFDKKPEPVPLDGAKNKFEEAAIEAYNESLLSIQNFNTKLNTF